MLMNLIAHPATQNLIFHLRASPKREFLSRETRQI
jgi:hypothetical protein